MTTITLLNMGIVPRVSIIDGKVGRKPFLAAITHLEAILPFQKIKSGPGFISSVAVTAIKEALTRTTKQVVLVNGEEDLLVLPVIVHASPDMHILYGQPDEGMVLVRPTEEMKRNASGLLQRFKKSVSAA